MVQLVDTSVFIALERRHTFVDRVLSVIPVIPFDLSSAQIYARLLVDLRNSGQTVGTHDLQIAATAMARGVEVATHNVRDFERVPGLVVRRIDTVI